MTISLRGLQKRFGERTAVEGLTFEVAPGEIFGLLGPNGAGKTTTVRMLTGLLRPTSGEGTVCGVSLGSAAAETALRARVGLLTEQPGLYERLTALENLSFFIRLYELDEAQALALARHYLEEFGLLDRENEPVGGFSKGMRQKLAIVRTLLHRPEVVFFDEPTSGLDPQSARVVRNAIALLAAEGRTLILCSHNLAEVEQLCTRVAVIQTRLRQVASLRELRKESLAIDIQLDGPAATWVATVEQLPLQATARAEGTRLHVSLAQDSDAPEIIAALVYAKARVFSVTRASRPLEEAYLECIREGV